LHHFIPSLHFFLQVAALRSQGKHKQAIEALHDVVKVFQSDTTSWLELADLHLSLCDYQVTPLFLLPLSFFLPSLLHVTVYLYLTATYVIAMW
jgi:hypothetical protein